MGRHACLSAVCTLCKHWYLPLLAAQTCPQEISQFRFQFQYTWPKGADVKARNDEAYAVWSRLLSTSAAKPNNWCVRNKVLRLVPLGSSVVCVSGGHHWQVTSHTHPMLQYMQGPTLALVA